MKSGLFLVVCLEMALVRGQRGKQKLEARIIAVERNLKDEIGWLRDDLQEDRELRRAVYEKLNDTLGLLAGTTHGGHHSTVMNRSGENEAGSELEKLSSEVIRLKNAFKDEKSARKANARELKLATIQEIKQMKQETIEQIKQMKQETVEQIKQIERETTEQIERMKQETNEEIKLTRAETNEEIMEMKQAAIDQINQMSVQCGKTPDGERRQEEREPEVSRGQVMQGPDFLISVSSSLQSMFGKISFLDPLMTALSQVCKTLKGTCFASPCCFNDNYATKGLAAVHVLPTKALDNIRLVAGRVEVFHEEQWGTVCSKGFDDVDATVICRMFGYNTGLGFKPVDSRFWARFPPPAKVWLCKLECSIQDSSIFACPHSDWGNVYYGHNYDVGVVCG